MQIEVFHLYKYVGSGPFHWGLCLVVPKLALDYSITFSVRAFADQYWHLNSSHFQHFPTHLTRVYLAPVSLGVVAFAVTNVKTRPVKLELKRDTSLALHIKEWHVVGATSRLHQHSIKQWDSSHLSRLQVLRFDLQQLFAFTSLSHSYRFKKW